MEHAAAALVALMEPMRLLALFCGMMAGMVLGLLPGLGGVAAASILLPFVFLFDDLAGLALLLGAVSVIYTSDTITSVLVGAPGSPASVPTSIEGHALAKQGKATTAMGLSFLASATGGLVGAMTLALAIPVAGPIVLALGTPELFMLTLVGLVFASSMVGKNIAIGLAAACSGLLLGVIGAAPAAANYRLTFGQPYLMDGLSLTIVALGLFAVAEIVGMLAGGGAISSGNHKLGNWMDGFTAYWRNRWLILRSALIGTIGGFVPAVGANASTWVAYGHAMSSTKDKSKFGKGEERGIAASEGANNATAISDLIPTLLFSVPGGPAAAIFLGALFSFGYYPGPRMVSEQPTLMYLIVWSVALASIVGAALCFAATPILARVTRIRFALIAAPLMLIMIAGAYQATQSLGDIAMLIGLGIVGWFMKQAEWPRAPILVGFVLAGPMEQYFWLSNQIHGWNWLTRPGVLIIATLIILPLLFKLWSRYRNRQKTSELPTKESDVPRTATSISRITLAIIAVPVFAYAGYEALSYGSSARLLPLLATVPGLIFSLIILWREASLFLHNPSGAELDGSSEYPVLLFFLLYGIAIALLGFNLATIGFLVVILLGYARMKLVTGLLYTALLLLLINGMFLLMRIGVPAGYFIDWQIF